MGVKYIWYDKLYLSDKISKKKKTIIKKIESGKFDPNYYLITIADTGDNMLDICNCIEYHQKFYDNHTKYVVGIARNKQEAIDIVVEIIDKMYKEIGNFDICSYLDFPDKEVR